MHVGPLVGLASLSLLAHQDKEGQQGRFRSNAQAQQREGIRVERDDSEGIDRVKQDPAYETNDLGRYEEGPTSDVGDPVAEASGRRSLAQKLLFKLGDRLDVSLDRFRDRRVPLAE